LGFSLNYLFYFFEKSGKKESLLRAQVFLINWPERIELRKQMLAGLSEKDIRASWQPALNQYKALRKKYLIYR
jgi:uncharacterized protein YbbC (DUF1343 family)